MTEVFSFILSQLAALGPSGLIIAFLMIAVSALWKALRDERSRNEKMVSKMMQQSAQAMTMVERIAGR